ncbi:10863_t:CDS:1, partial [Ambispora gerdemannii]
LKNYVEQIESFRGQEIYYSLTEEISAIKKKLAAKNPAEYGKNNADMISNELVNKGVKEDQLSSENQKRLKDLEAGKITDPTEIDEVKNQISEETNEKAAENELDKLLEEYEKAPNLALKKVIRNKIIQFVNNKDNRFQQKAFKSRLNKVNKILGIANTNAQ